MASANLSACSILWLLFVSHSFLPSVSSTDELSLVIFESASLQLSPSLIVEKSLGSKPGTNVKCERVHIYGFRRLKHLSKFANLLKVKVSYVNPSGRMSRSVSTVFLVLGITMLTLASWLSKSLVFYYIGAMSVGVLHVILGMKLLPTGWKSSLAIFIYSCSVGLGFFLLDHVPRLVHSVLLEIGISEDMYNPLAIFLLVFLVIAGAWLGFWIVRKLVLTEDGSIDIGVSHFVAWSIRVVASVMILQSSEDHLFAVEALIGGIFVYSALRKLNNPKVIHRVYKRLCRLEINLGISPNIDESCVNRPFTKSPRTPFQGSISKSSGRLSDLGSFFSSFHNTSERRKFSKDEWEGYHTDGWSGFFAGF